MLPIFLDNQFTTDCLLCTEQIFGFHHNHYSRSSWSSLASAPWVLCEEYFSMQCFYWINCVLKNLMNIVLAGLVSVKLKNLWVWCCMKSRIYWMLLKIYSNLKEKENNNHLERDSSNAAASGVLVLIRKAVS